LAPHAEPANHWQSDLRISVALGNSITYRAVQAGDQVVFIASSQTADVISTSHKTLVNYVHPLPANPGLFVLYENMLIGGFAGGVAAAPLPRAPLPPPVKGKSSRVTALKVVRNVLVAGNEGGVASVHALDESLSPLALARAHVGPVTLISDASTEQQSRVCTAGAEGDVVLFGLPNLVCLLRLCGHVGGVRSIVTESGFIKVTSDVMHLWNIRSGALERLAANSSTIHSAKRFGATMLLQLPVSLEAGRMENQGNIFFSRLSMCM